MTVFEQIRPRDPAFHPGVAHPQGSAEAAYFKAPHAKRRISFCERCDVAPCFLATGGIRTESTPKGRVFCGITCPRCNGVLKQTTMLREAPVLFVLAKGA